MNFTDHSRYSESFVNLIWKNSIRVVHEKWLIQSVKQISCFLFLLALSVYAEKEKLKVVSNAKELITANSKKIIWKKDGAEMVIVHPYKPAKYKEKQISIPFGETTTESIKVSNKLLPLWFDTTEVTIGQFKKFLAESGHYFEADLWTAIYKFSPTDKHPMILVNWGDAMAYAKWAGKRLPTEKEWEFAARGGLTHKKYSWGDDKSLAQNYANCVGSGGKDKWILCTAPIGSFKPNGYGLYDMVGNVSEWCQDWYDSNQDRKVLRGGSWRHFTDNLRLVCRYYGSPTSRTIGSGFRCVSGSP